MNTIRHILQIKGNDLWTIASHATVFDALRMMADKDVGALLVMDKDQLVGIISERDYARKIILHGKTSKDTLVHEVMVQEIYPVHPDQTIQECMELMTQKRVRYVPVMEGERVVGIISIGDVVRDIMYQQREQIKDLEKKVLFQQS